MCLISKSFQFVSKVSSTFYSPIHHFTHIRTHSSMWSELWISSRYPPPFSSCSLPCIWHYYQLPQLVIQYKICFTYLVYHYWTICIWITRKVLSLSFRIWFIRLNYSCMKNQSNVAENFNFLVSHICYIWTVEKAIHENNEE